MCRFVGLVLLFGSPTPRIMRARPALISGGLRLARGDRAYHHHDFPDRRPYHSVVHAQLDGQAGNCTRALPTQPQSLDLLVIAATALALLFWLVFPDDRLTGFMLILAAAAQLLRLSRWGGHRAVSDPLVLILHLGYAWVPIGLLLLGLSVAGFDSRAAPEFMR